MNLLKSHSKNNSDTIATILNIGSFGINAIVGLLLNFLIIEFYNSESLGVFNISYAIYIFLSQACVFGVHNSVLKHSSDYSTDKIKLGHVLSSSILLVGTWGGGGLILCFFLEDLFMPFYDSKKSLLSFQIILPGVFFFILNKVQFSFINGIGRLKTFAVFLGLRGVLMFVVFAVLLRWEMASEFLSLVFVVAEFILFLVLGLYLIRFYVQKKSLQLDWIKKHISFGGQSFLGSFLMDVTSKTDILVLGLFVSDPLVGLYSFISFFMEGFNQIPMVLRSITSPKINHLYRIGKLSSLEGYLKGIIKKSYFGFIPFGLVCILCFPLITYLSPQIDLSLSWGIITVLLIGPIIESGYSSVQMVFNQCGFPKTQSLFALFAFLWNLSFNFLLIPIWGIYGAAIATSSAFILKVFLMKYLARQKIGISI